MYGEWSISQNELWYEGEEKEATENEEAHKPHTWVANIPVTGIQAPRRIWHTIDSERSKPPWSLWYNTRHTGLHICPFLEQFPLFPFQMKQ
jgi:hypothetical protein